MGVTSKGGRRNDVATTYNKAGKEVEDVGAGVRMEGVESNASSSVTSVRFNLRCGCSRRE